MRTLSLSLSFLSKDHADGERHECFEFCSNSNGSPDESRSLGNFASSATKRQAQFAIVPFVALHIVTVTTMANIFLAIKA